ncbi:MAG: T9SS type A sorting domain-containing protein, partial [Candidatus Marinimicrobia bacterium]|nr:T9SS type A sorting domain-containing protein [Candidatus Neomarinimicrobiota bacterium]
TSGSCARCHTGGGFIQHVEDLAENPYPGGMATASCQACHDPHSVENTHQLRTLETTTLMNGVTITEGGTGKLCMNCHMTRRDANSYAEVGNTSSHFGPHYGVQADMLAATNAIMFGQQLPTSPHLTATENACVDCHMYNDNGHDDNNVPLEYGGHSFNMSDPITGREHVEACASCHGDVGTTFAEKLFFMNGFADHDGDGTVEGLQDEVHGLLDELAAALPHADSVAGYDPHDRPTLEWTRTEIKAAYNYDYVYYDHSYGIHNPAYTVALLKVSIQALLNNAVEGDIVAIEDVPNDQGYAVRIVWDKFVDDGVSLDPVEDYIVKRYDDFGDNPGFTTVGELLADGAPRYAMVVPTVFNLVGTDTAAALTEFIVVALHESGAVNASLPGEGFAIDNLVPAAPTNVLASAVDNYSVDLAWDASIDTDVNYYIVYRDGVEITTTADLTFTDSGLALGEYTYEITAVDFNGNEGDPSAGVSAEVLSVDPGSMPIEYTLAQNYPNPFNPVTTIKFSLPEAGLVNVTVFNSVGQVVSELVNKNMDIGYHSINFSADNLPSGVYFYTISSNSFTQTKKMILLK